MPATELVTARSAGMDRALEVLWSAYLPADAEACLVAVGGYGRRELFPHSDVDLLVLLGEDVEEHIGDALRELVTAFWDLGVKIGHSVRTVAECIEHGRDDVTIATNLFEARPIVGATMLFGRLEIALAGPDFWPAETFFRAKRAEQRARYRKYDESGAKIEPNVKESPGGLRDVQTISWVTRRHFGTGEFFELVEHGFLTDDEYAELTEGRALLFRIRMALHLLAGRTEDRLLLDYQRDIAHQFGYAGGDANQAVEQFMQTYFRGVLGLQRLNDMLLQLFEEAILQRGAHHSPCPLNPRFQTRMGFLETTGPEIFAREPAALMELFLILARLPELRGVRAKTIRQIRRNLDRVDDELREDMRVTGMFRAILRQPGGPYPVLQKMNRYGFLAAYIPEFGQIVGRMQFDLFHVYTVDEHTLLVIRNLERFAGRATAGELPLPARLMRELRAPETLYITALFHDIAKGRGGDHEVLGALDAEAFCRRHACDSETIDTVTWLVRNHLLMSFTAQRRDISDPKVVEEFAGAVATPRRLALLYLLTVADIRATNPSLWNSWRDALLRELFENTREALEGESRAALPDAEAMVETTKNEALALLEARPEDVDPDDVQRFWEDFSDEYFLQRSPEEAAWHTALTLDARQRRLPIIGIRQNRERHCTEVAIYTSDHPFLFARVTTLLTQRNLNVVSAGITTAASGHTLDTFHVLGPDGRPLEDRWMIDDLRRSLVRSLREAGPPDATPPRALSRRKRQFDVATRIELFQDRHRDRTIVQIETADYPGLLARMALAFAESGVQVQSAKIATLGERAEDIFFVTDGDGHALIDEALRDRLVARLHQRIDDDDSDD